MVALDKGNVSIIPAHGTPLRAMELSPDGEILLQQARLGHSYEYSLLATALELESCAGA